MDARSSWNRNSSVAAAKWLAQPHAPWIVERIRCALWGPSSSSHPHGFSGAPQCARKQRREPMPKPRPPIPRFPKNAAAPVPYPIGRGRLPERLRPDAKSAQQVQRSLLPAELPQVPGYQFFAYYKPAQEVGGDYYDFIPLPPKQRRLAILLGDAAGKGVLAALLMAKLSSVAPASLLSEADPPAAIAALHHLADRYTT